MKRTFAVAFLLGALACGLSAQTQPVDTTVCAVMKNPTAFNGKMVRIKGTAVVGFDQFVLEDGNCGQQVNGIWIAYPEGTKGKAGPLALVEVGPAHNYAGTLPAAEAAPVTLVHDKAFKQFDSLLAQTDAKGGGMCLGCFKNHVQATLVGRLDAVADPIVRHNSAGKVTSLGGFGNLNGYPVRLVLESVADVTAKEVDYSKADAVTKKAQPENASSADLSDSKTTAEKLVKALLTNPIGEMLQKDLDVYGHPNEQNGVVIGFGDANSVSEALDKPAADDSPDGAMYYVTFNHHRLDASTEPLAILHIGQHIEDLRHPRPGNEDAPPYILEYDGWIVTVSAATAEGEKFLTLPGGYLAWDANWPADERTSHIEKALSDFLANETLLSK